MTDIFDDEKIILLRSGGKGSDTILIWIQLLCLAGKINNSGLVFVSESVPYTTEMLSAVLRFDSSVIAGALDKFEEYGMISREDGIIAISNWAKYQNVESLEKYREDARKRMARYRSRQKAARAGEVASPLRNVTDTEEDVNTDADTDVKEDNERANIYPSLGAKVNEWIAYKGGKGSHSALLSLVSDRAVEYGADNVCALIDECMANGWRTIVWERLARQTGGSAESAGYDYDGIERAMWTKLKSKKEDGN